MNFWLLSTMLCTSNVAPKSIGEMLVLSETHPQHAAAHPAPGNPDPPLQSSASIETALTSFDWTVEGDQSDAWFGASVAGAGDVNGDGYDDVIVGAPSYDAEWDPFTYAEGRASLYLGSSSGLASSPGWTVESLQAGASLGYSVAGAGDVNGDGYDDVIVGAPGYDAGQSSEGRAFVYFGSASGLAFHAAWRAESDQTDARFGFSVAGAGDVNGDGYDDVIVGAPFYNAGQSSEGRAFLYFGSASGLSPSPAWMSESDQSGAVFGYSTKGAGDVNGDGYDDVIVGAPGYDIGQSSEGRAFLYFGSASGLSSSPAWTAESDQSDARFGDSVAGAGDVNGDGYDEVIVGAPGYDAGQSSEGRAFVYFGSASGPTSTPAWRSEGRLRYDFFETSVAGAGDLDGDGYGDVVLGRDPSLFDWGRTDVYLGSPSGLAPEPALVVNGTEISDSFGASVASAGDVNGDGLGDLIVGAPGSSKAGAVGLVVVVHGFCDTDDDGLCYAADNCPRIQNPVQSDADSDGLGDPCDNCPIDYNPDQADADGDGAADACDCYPSVPSPHVDRDGDGRDDLCDTCPYAHDPTHADADADGRGDLCDVCPTIPDPLQEDRDRDAAGDACDDCASAYDPMQRDADRDGVGDRCDNCPTAPNAGQGDMDHDGQGDVCDITITSPARGTAFVGSDPPPTVSWTPGRAKRFQVRITWDPQAGPKGRVTSGGNLLRGTTWTVPAARWRRAFAKASGRLQVVILGKAGGGTELSEPMWLDIRCLDGTANCAGTCTEVTANPASCGQCGLVCPSFTTCVGGTCTCPGGESLCGGECVDLASNDANCGACGTACPPVSSCAAGTCACPGGLALCGGGCADLASDDANCGACGVACPPGTCVGGECICPGALTPCGTYCTDLTTGWYNCGRCGVSCAGLEDCSSGVCVCEPPNAVCAGSCVDPASDPGNCGSCGRVCPAPTTRCFEGDCYCPLYGILCDGKCVQFLWDNENCGGCGLICHGTCCYGSCVTRGTCCVWPFGCF